MDRVVILTHWRNLFIVVIALFLLFFFLGFLPIANILRIESVFKGNRVTASYTEPGGSSCSGWGGDIIISDSQLLVGSHSNFGQCSGNSGSADATIYISDPATISSIYITLSGTLSNGGYSGTSNCPSSSLSGVLRQVSSINLFSSDVGCSGNPVENIPNNILLTFNNGFVSTSTGNILKLEYNSDLLLIFASSSSAGSNGRSASSSLVISGLVVTRKDVLPVVPPVIPPVVVPPVIPPVVVPPPVIHLSFWQSLMIKIWNFFGWKW